MGRFKENICKSVNKLFRLPVHPFNLQRDGIKTYAEWQFEKGAETIKFFLEYSTVEEMFKDKTVLDIGCGAAGKTLYYASCGVKKIYGTDIVSKYKEESLALAIDKNLTDRFEFVLADVSNLPFKDETFDTIVMNDVMEHLSKPVEILNECHRVLKPKGRLYVNFPPYYHPYGAHLSDLIGIPWAQIFFDDNTLISVYKDLAKNLPDGEERVRFRISRNENGKEFFSYINKMTVKKFKSIYPDTKLSLVYYREIPLRNSLKLFVETPVIKEFFVKMVVAIFEKNYEL
jgi:ubiquinone/menaquinone biosynthesis C-methylase UbiE